MEHKDKIEPSHSLLQGTYFSISLLQIQKLAGKLFKFLLSSIFQLMVYE
jgi:hypothetical protein